MQENYSILTDEDISRLPDDAILEPIRQALLARAEGKLIAPPRFSVDAGSGSLIFTAGAETRSSNSLGFRVYGTFPDPGANQDQVTVVYDSRTGQLRGLVIGRLLGALRTAAINAIAIQTMSRQDSTRLGILGSGFQAHQHARLAMAVRDFREIKIFSPTPAHRDSFAAQLSQRGNIPVEAVQSPEEVVRFADVLICATRSTSPILDLSWLHSGMHINTIGPKFQGASELPHEVAERAQVIATDSRDQMNAYPEPFFLSDTPAEQRIIELSDIVAGKQLGRKTLEDITLFCSVGLAGTEVVLANDAIQRI